MQADAEHQKDHADFGKLERQCRIRDETGRKRADGNARKQIAGDRRDPQIIRERA